MDPTWGWLEWTLFLSAWTAPVAIVGRWLWFKLRSRQWWALVVALPAAFVLICVCSALVKPYFGARAAGATAKCQSNLQQLSSALMMYAQDHDERLPSARTWRTDIAKYVSDDSVFHCPFDREGHSYAFNKALSGRRQEDVDEVSRTVLLFESGGLDFGTVNDVPARGRHTSTNVLFCDGQARSVAPGKVSELIWSLAPVRRGAASATSP